MIKQPYVSTVHSGQRHPTPCVILECDSTAEANTVMTALNEFIRQFKQHFEKVQEEN